MYATFVFFYFFLQAESALLPKHFSNYGFSTALAAATPPAVSSLSTVLNSGGFSSSSSAAVGSGTTQASQFGGSVAAVVRPAPVDTGDLAEALDRVLEGIGSSEKDPDVIEAARRANEEMVRDVSEAEDNEMLLGPSPKTCLNSTDDCCLEEEHIGYQCQDEYATWTTRCHPVTKYRKICNGTTEGDSVNLQKTILKKCDSDEVWNGRSNSAQEVSRSYFTTEIPSRPLQEIS